MITLYELIKRAKKGDVLYTSRPAKNVTSAASRLGRRVTTEKCVVYPVVHRHPKQAYTGTMVLRVEVLS